MRACVSILCCVVMAACGGGSTAGDAGSETKGDVYIPDTSRPDAASDLPAEASPEVLPEVLPDVTGPLGCPAPGQVIITEMMVSPLSSGEYVEIYNASDVEFKVDSRWALQSKAGTKSEEQPILVDTPILFPPKGYLLLAKAPGTPDSFGGKAPDYVYQKLTLADTGDTVRIACDGNVLDEVVYASSQCWPHKKGFAMSLDPSGYDATRNDGPDYWCSGQDKFGKGDRGTPGAPNKPCGLASCGDKCVQAWEECDDGNSKPGDGCEPTCIKSPDKDQDGVPDGMDNCPDVGNPDQKNSDGDKHGDACDPPTCGNGTVEANEECDDKNQKPGDGCEPDCKKSVDSDGDGVYDSVDNCPHDANTDQADQDGDGVGDACDRPDCGNGFLEGAEECDDKNTMSGDGCSYVCTKESFEVGSVIVSEIMYQPVLPVTRGEYVELYNTTDQPVDVAGWKMGDGGTHMVTLKPEEGTLVIAPKSYLLLARNGDPELNGGFDADYVYGESLGLDDKAAKIVLVWNGVEIDKVLFGSAYNFPEAKGRSLNLSADCLDATQNDLPECWCATSDDSPLPLPSSGFGTPGEANETCTPVGP